MKKQIIINYQLLLFLVINIFSFILLFYFFKNEFSNYVIFKTIVFIGLLWIPYLVSNAIGTKIPKIIYQFYFFFIIFDLLLGEILMVDRIIGFYSYLMLFIQGVINYVFGLWIIKHYDDYGIISFRLINIFSLLFAITLSSFKEIFYYLINLSFSINVINQMLNLLIASIGTFMMGLFIIFDRKQMKGKYYNLLDNEMNRRTN